MTRSAVVTGANSGIGKSTALELARAGWRVVGTVRTPEKAAALAEAAAERGLTLETVGLDVADAQSCASAMAEVTDLLGDVPDALVNNAGYAQSGAMEDIDDDTVRAQLETNLVAPLRLARLVLPGMRARGSGRIINVSSIAGRVSSPMTGWYCASKAGLEAASDALRVEVAPFGIHVSLVEPGGFGTGIWDAGQQALPVSASGAYDAAYARAHAATGRAGALLPDPVWVARVIRLSLSSPRPLPRYLVGFDAMGALAGDRLAPTAVADYVKGVAAGLRGVLPGLPRLR